MDYKAKGVDELSLSQGDSLRVYKKYVTELTRPFSGITCTNQYSFWPTRTSLRLNVRLLMIKESTFMGLCRYNNWSYAINETHADKPRGWTPSWLVGGRKDSLTSSATSTLKSKRSGSNLLAPKSLEGIQIKQDNFQSREQELGIQMSAAWKSPTDFASN